MRPASQRRLSPYAPTRKKQARLPMEGVPAPFPAPRSRGRFFAARRAALNLAHASGPRSGAPGAPGALLSARVPGAPSSPPSSARTSP